MVCLRQFVQVALFSKSPTNCKWKEGARASLSNQKHPAVHALKRSDVILACLAKMILNIVICVKELCFEPTRRDRDQNLANAPVACEVYGRTCVKRWQWKWHEGMNRMQWVPWCGYRRMTVRKRGKGEVSVLNKGPLEVFGKKFQEALKLICHRKWFQTYLTISNE